MFPDGFYAASSTSSLEVVFWSWQLLTQALVGGVPGGPGPGSVLVEGVTSLAVVPRCVMLADTEQPPLLALGALAGVAVALTPEGGRDADGKGRFPRTRVFSVYFSGVNLALERR